MTFWVPRNWPRSLAVSTLFVSLSLVATARAAQIFCGEGYVSPGAGGCCLCGGLKVHVTCANTSHCCPDSSLCDGASQAMDVDCEKLYCKDTKFNFRIRAYSTNLETGSPLSIAGAVNEPYHLKSGVRQPAGVSDPTVLLLDDAGQPLVVNNTAVVLTAICGATSGLGATTACEPEALKPARNGDRWIEFESTSAIPSDPNGNLVPYQFVATWAELSDEYVIQTGMDQRVIGGWISTDQDDLYGIPTPDFFTQAQMDPLLPGQAVPMLDEGGLITMALVVCALGIVILKMRQA